MTAASPPLLPCPHPYLPLAEGARWDHVVRAGRTKTRARTTIGRIEKTATSWRAPVEVRSGERVLRGTAECSTHGAFMDMGALHAVGGAEGLRVASDLRSAGHEGPLLAGADAFLPDTAWTVGLATLVSAGDSLTKRSTVRAELRFRRLADERVETPAGDFDAAHLVAESTGTEESVIMGRSVPARSLAPWRVELWLAPGVGEVKSAMTQGEDEIVWTLAEHEVPPAP